MAYEMAVMLAGVGMAAMFFHLSTQMRDDKIWKVVQSLFFFMGIFALLQTISLGRLIAGEEAAPAGVLAILDSMMQLVTWALYISVAFFVVMIIYTALSWAWERQK